MMSSTQGSQLYVIFKYKYARLAILIHCKTLIEGLKCFEWDTRQFLMMRKNRLIKKR